MKKIMTVIIVSAFFSCTSNEKKTTDATKTTTDAGVKNVNGNIPDTTNSINLSTRKTKDSAK